MKFQLTRPVWGEPLPSIVSPCIGTISTHSPRVGRTTTMQFVSILRSDFNSLAPCGANRVTDSNDNWRPDISTHSPRVGRTFAELVTIMVTAHFNSLAPCGANHDVVGVAVQPGNFNSLAPCGANPAA